MTDVNNAVFAYGVNMLRMLLKMGIITEEEYGRIVNIQRECYETVIIL